MEDSIKMLNNVFVIITYAFILQVHFFQKQFVTYLIHDYAL
jgi:hypothetical protein